MPPVARYRIRYFLTLSILATLPCYCAGFVALVFAPRGQSLARPTQVIITLTPAFLATFTSFPTFTDLPPLASSTATYTPTPTLTVTPSPIPSATGTPTLTPTQTMTPFQPQVTNTPLPTATATPPNTPTLTPTPTATSTLTPGPTATISDPDAPNLFPTVAPTSESKQESFNVRPMTPALNLIGSVLSTVSLFGLTGQ